MAAADNLNERLSVGVVSRSRFEEAQRLGYSEVTDKPNEDTVFADPKTGLFVVADGLSGYEGGALASTRAVEAFMESVGDQSEAKKDKLEIVLRQGLGLADVAIYDTKGDSPE